MANSQSAKKRVRQGASKTIARTMRMSLIRRHFRKVEEAIVAGDKAAAKEAFESMQPKLMSGINKKIVHRNMVSRKLSRFPRKIKNIPG